MGRLEIALDTLTSQIGKTVIVGENQNDIGSAVCGARTPAGDHTE